MRHPLPTWSLAFSTDRSMSLWTRRPENCITPTVRMAVNNANLAERGRRQTIAVVGELLEHRMGFEPMNTGFADQRVSHFATGASAPPRASHATENIADVLLRLGCRPQIRLHRLVSRKGLIRLFVRDRTGNDHIFALLPVSRRRHPVLCRQLH